ncbi:MAG: UDP-4-amino-4,6-dideoxy-N-acetyl-beta-L-altrosamine transaminase [Candidatus Omnitrophica bacterium]|nr:UDP-4-amino-4,6-dideoxy-N-acetyl-beta-L-altrosamine transaminase [Candidatus Omnitrophota bacterium]
MKQIPYANQWIEEDDMLAVTNALKSSNLTQGPLIEEFEKNMAQYCGVKYAVAVNSGTSALHIACLAAGVGGGDEVITSANTFVASANCVLYCGGKPVFADIEADTACIDPKDIKKKITDKTKAIIPVHFAGQPADMEEIHKIAKEKNLVIIEDAAHAIGAKYRVRNSHDWVKVGSCFHSDMTILSFHPVKHITTGEGGMVLTNNHDLYEKLVFFRSHGITRNKKYMKETEGLWYYEMHELGFNYRITDIQCSLGISQLKKIDRFIAKRKEIAKIYDKAFSEIEQLDYIKERDGFDSSRHLYVILTEDRKNVFNWLIAEANMLVNVHYIPVYFHPYYRRLGHRRGLCPVAENYYSRAISIPMFPKLTINEAEYVVAKIKQVVSG